MGTKTWIPANGPWTDPIRGLERAPGDPMRTPTGHNGVVDSRRARPACTPPAGHYSWPIATVGDRDDGVDRRRSGSCLRVPGHRGRELSTMTEREYAVQARIASLVESVRDDQAQSRELFQYVWAMMCVRQGLLRPVGTLIVDGESRIVLEEVRTGRQRRVLRPRGMDADLEDLAVAALARILAEVPLAG